MKNTIIRLDMSKKRLLGMLFLLLIYMNSLATEQSMDEIMYNDSISFIFSSDLISDLRPIRGYPLEYYLWNTKHSLEQRKVIEEMLKVYRWCLRGYIAKWEIRNDSLFLLEISYKPTTTAYVQGKLAESFLLERLFPDRDVTNGVFADWFSGLIRTVTYNRTYPAFLESEWTDKRKIFYLENGLLIGMRRR